MREVRETAVGASGRRVLWAEGAAKAKVLGWGHSPVCLKTMKDAGV